ncbi:hypothetical protein [Bythopirellula goksoeyrii]|uniref:Uncharacterized protein n=1 Tax=Bythopirellula goksoeyrii TaxID=1400387 RepID=A0A5B9QQA8_9BACT|nr:hypothetical protein [Bythopirellula goksoeyrii]QEG36143.1 hypothetical protein Pr1d_34520 [Bythopirellula goksoeyrii]
MATRSRELAGFTSSEFGEARLPLPEPIPEAVEAGVFTEAIPGTGAPNEPQVRAITVEYARVLYRLLQDLAYLTECASQGISPDTGRPFPTQQEYVAAFQAMNTEAHRLTDHYRSLIETYACGFGYEAAEALDQSMMQLVDRPIKVPLPKRVPIQQK